MIEVREYTKPHGHNRFQQWFEDFGARAAPRVTVALSRVEQGNVSNVKGVAGRVLELRIDYGPGSRVYFGEDGRHLVILLGGGTKKRQNRDIRTAQDLWTAYKARK